MATLPSVFVSQDNRGSGNGGFDPLPPGWYEAEIIKSVMKDTKNGDGKYLAITFKIIDGDYAKRLVFTNLNLVNNSAVAVEIAHRDLAAICDACDVEELEDTEDLHNIPLRIKLKIEAGNASFPDRNAVVAYKPID